MTSRDFDVIAIENPAIDIFHTPENTVLESGGGSGANVVVHLSRLGLKTCLIGFVGDDDYGHIILEELRKEGVDTERIRKLQGDTRTWTMQTSPQSYRRIGRTSGVGVRKLTSKDVEYLNLSKSLYVNLTHSLFEESSAVADDNGLYIFTSLQGLSEPHTNLPLLSKRRIKILFSNKEEATVEKNYITDVIENGKTLVVITHGAGGCEVYKGNYHERYHGLKVNSIDTVGAGDAFSSGFIYGYFRGWELPEVCAFANGMGALATTFYGARSRKISKNEVMSIIKHY
ncbi:MAG: carbohydrate kinase family protein [Candidatus Aenigmarchaeota archaeon]|nr:carbohydrate kinase family protein [Candidatus Aenigmarchaeota archaeon]